MKELEQILRDHALRYPKMQPCDAVKLIYQNEFGGGHLIRDEKMALAYLRREYDGLEKIPQGSKKEPIGNGIVRVFLASLDEQELEQLGQRFLASAKACKGEKERFLLKLSVLRVLTAEGIFSFSAEELEKYLLEYEKAGYPMVSHSEIYRQAYRPAYRIVLERGAEE